MSRPDIIENEVDAEQYDKHWSERKAYIKEHPYMQPMITMIEQSGCKLKNVLEVGAGFGFAAVKIIQKFDPETYVAYEFSSAIYHLMGMLRNFKSNCEVFLFKKSFRDMACPELYDCVIAMEIFEHITWDLEFVKRLSPGTKVFFSLPTHPSKFHVRHFETEKEVRDRYESILNINEIIFVPDKWWCIDSTRKD